MTKFFLKNVSIILFFSLILYFSYSIGQWPVLGERWTFSLMSTQILSKLLNFGLFLILLAFFRSFAFINRKFSFFQTIIPTIAALSLCLLMLFFVSSREEDLKRFDKAAQVRLLQKKENSLHPKRINFTRDIAIMPGRLTQQGYANSIISIKVKGTNIFFIDADIKTSLGKWKIMNNFTIRKTQPTKGALEIGLSQFQNRPDTQPAANNKLLEITEKLVSWPIYNKKIKNKNLRILESIIASLGLLLFASGLGMLLNIKTAVMNERIFTYILFLLFFVIPVYLIYAGWEYIYTKNLINASITHYMKASILLVIGLVVFFAGRKKQTGLK